MKKQKVYPAGRLAQELELEPTEQALHEYIEETFNNGNRSAPADLFAQLEEHSQLNAIGYLKEKGRADIMFVLLARVIGNNSNLKWSN